jgi:glycosyltransferase
MKISVVTVTYNSASTLAHTLRSVSNQSHQDIEHIIIDGASTDSTLELIQSEGRRVTTVVSEPDSGIYEAMNKGLRLATGEMVGFLNADDIYADDAVVADIARVANDSTADATYGDLVYIDNDCPSRAVRHWRSQVFRRSRLPFGWMPPHPTFYIRRSLLTKLGVFDDTLKIAADFDFMLRYLSQPGFKATYMARILVHMRTGGASNASLSALLRKSREDLFVLRKNGVGGWFTLICKNMRKIVQFVAPPSIPE